MKPTPTFDVFIKAIDAEQAKKKNGQSNYKPEAKTSLSEKIPLLGPVDSGEKIDRGSQSAVPESKSIPTVSWIELSEKEKEYYLARCFMSALKKVSHIPLSLIHI